MRAAGIKMPASAAGNRQEGKRNSFSNNNLTQLFKRVNMLCNKWKISREELERAAAVWAFMLRESAPRDVQILFSGRPSFYSEDAKRLSLAFLIAYTEADYRLKALGTNDPVDACECWRLALRLVGGAA